MRRMLNKGKCEVLPQAQEPLRVVNLVVNRLQAMAEALLQLRMRMISQHLFAGLSTFSFHPETPPTFSPSLTLIFQAVRAGY